MCLLFHCSPSCPFPFTYLHLLPVFHHLSHLLVGSLLTLRCEGFGQSLVVLQVLCMYTNWLGTCLLDINLSPHSFSTLLLAIT